MSQPPDNPTQPVPADATREQPAAEVPAADAASPAWASAVHEGDATASARPVPVAGVGHLPLAATVAPARPAAPMAKKSWSSRVSGGRGLAVGALVVGMGLGMVAGSAATWAVTHDDRGPGTTADERGRFDHDRDGNAGPPGGRGEMPPGGQLPGGQLPGGGGPGRGGSDDAPGSDANGTSRTT